MLQNSEFNKFVNERLAAFNNLTKQDKRRFANNMYKAWLRIHPNAQFLKVRGNNEDVASEMMMILFTFLF